jgi:hypothetical protein
MAFKTKMLVLAGIIIVASVGLFFWPHKAPDTEQPAQNEKIDITSTKGGPNSEDYFNIQEETRLAAETPLTISRQPLPPSGQIAQEMVEKNIAELEARTQQAASQKTNYPGLPALNPNEIAKVIPTIVQPKPSGTPAASPTPVKPLTDQQIFSILYPATQTNQLNEFQNNLVGLGVIKESDRVVFDSEAKIRDFVAKQMNMACSQNYVTKEYCDNFNRLGIDAFFAQKKIEENLLRQNGSLKSSALTLETFYQVTPPPPPVDMPEYSKMIRNLTPGKKLTDHEIFAILYSPNQLSLLNTMQDEMILAGYIPEADRLVFDNETKIRDFIVRSMAIGCPAGLVEKEFCVNFGQVGIGPFFAIKKEEEKSLRETGTLPKEPLSIERFRKYIAKKTLTDILAYTAESQETVSEVFSGCPNPAKTSLNDIGKFSPSNILSVVKDFLTGKPVNAHKQGYGYCTYWWPHIHSPWPGLFGCGYDLMPFTTPWPTEPIGFTGCCHCKVTKYCVSAGCINNQCGEWQQSLWDGMTGICGCGIYP